jgi:predicted DNA-binding ArsR family transcriptional regulator
MKNNITTLEGLAEMIQRSMASKEDIKEVKEDVTALRSEMRAGFERIENLLLEEQRRKIENLETRMKKLEDALAI